MGRKYRGTEQSISTYPNQLKIMLNKTGNIQARKYTESVVFYTTTSSVDDYGMETVSEVKGDTYDAQITQMSQYKKQLYFRMRRLQ